MEKQKEKRKAHKRRRQTKSTSTLPLDLASDILLRLPEKSVARFSCVSKLWLSITTDPYFIKTRSAQQSLLCWFRKDGNLYVFSIPQDTQYYSSSQPIDSYHLKFPGVEFSNLPPTESVHGLICFQEKENPIVWNPSKKEFLTLPKPRKSWKNLSVFLGYDPVGHKHKVMCMPLKRSSDVCRVLTLGSSQESWRSVKTNHSHRTKFQSKGRCIKGVIYYVAYIYHTKVSVIMSFDVRSEKFDMINFPSNIYWDRPITYHGKLAYVEKTRTGGGGLWILEDAEKHIWSRQHFLSPLGHYDEVSRTFFSQRGFTHAGEFVYAPGMFRKSSYVLFCDPVINSFRRFEFEQITHEDTYAALHVFPNHISSQISF